METEDSLKQIVFDSASVFLLDTSVLVLVFGFLEKVVYQQAVSFTYGIVVVVGSATTFMLSCYCRIWNPK